MSKADGYTAYSYSEPIRDDCSLLSEVRCCTLIQEFSKKMLLQFLFIYLCFQVGI